MASEHVEGRSASLAIRKMQVKTTRRPQFILARMPVFKQTDNTTKEDPDPRTLVAGM